MKNKLLKALRIAQAAEVPCILQGGEVDYVLNLVEGGEMVDVPLGLFLDCTDAIQGAKETYRVPLELIKTMRQALYASGNYEAELRAGELYRLIEFKDGKNERNS